MSVLRQTIEMAEIARDLDMLVYRLERAPPEDIDDLERERDRLRRELEQLRDRLNDLVRALDG